MLLWGPALSSYAPVGEYPLKKNMAAFAPEHVVSTTEHNFDQVHKKSNSDCCFIFSNKSIVQVEIRRFIINLVTEKRPFFPLVRLLSFSRLPLE